MSLVLRVRALKETTSTNDEVKRALDAGEPEGLVVRALRQTGGYGRQGRTWASPEGGLYCSMLLRPQVEPAALPTLSLVVSLAVRRAFVELAGTPAAEAVRIKWPNDVVLARDAAKNAHPPTLAENASYERFSPSSKNGDLEFCEKASDFAPKNRSQIVFSASKHADGMSEDAHAASPAKLCGISLEARGGGVCVGTGMNVFPPAEHLEVGGKNTPAYLAELAPHLARVPLNEALDTVFDAFAVAFIALYEVWVRDGFLPLVHEYNQHASLTGRTVQVVDHAETPLAQGTVVRVDSFGRLVLHDASGEEVSVSSGEAHLR